MTHEHVRSSVRIGQKGCTTWPSFSAVIENGILIAHCWAHVVRYFRSGIERNPEVEQVLALIGQLYQIERETKGDPKRLLERRKTEGKEILAKIQKWVFEQRVLKSSQCGKAIEYLKKYWIGLSRFTEDPEIDASYIALDTINAFCFPCMVNQGKSVKFWHCAATVRDFSTSPTSC